MEKKKRSSKTSIPFTKKKFQPKIAALEFPVRLNKFIAKCGQESRRSAAELIKTGVVKVNDKIVVEPFVMVEESDVVCIRGKQVRPVQELVYFLLNKPKNVISTTSDERGRQNVVDLVDYKGKAKIYPVGRLDRDTTGLLILTNDGELTMKLSHPSHNIQKKYEISLRKPLTEKDEKAIIAGVSLEDGIVQVDQLRFPKPNSRKVIELTIHSGRNRVIRRLFTELGYEIAHLDRTYYAGLTQKGVKRGTYRKLTNREVIMLRHFI